MTYPHPPGGWTDPTGQQSSPPVEPTLVAGQPVPTQHGPADPYAPVDPYAGGQFPPGQPMPGYAAPAYPPPYAGYGYPVPQKTNGMAIAALVLALLGLTSCITAPVGAILGHVAQKQIRLSGEGGEGMAKAAIIVGWILTGLLVLLIAFYVVVIVLAITTSAGDNTSSY
ncbi:DUF4190 domain-containing protein [Micromonospora cremea]|uniref:DUF4190 domain-containing protein n=1 Tax=Micromonospora cremea TaxID=709881 RepID=A0A1N6AEL0_9ACTN|nr:DUF4190 domain-containing protein [Micromonospora cremea]SIN32473.1 protein of unknown function [Micromonospora cremea]